MHCPRRGCGNGAVSDEPTTHYISAGAAGAVWQAKDLPMYLHIFAYITRGTLLNWWFAPTAA